MISRTVELQLEFLGPGDFTAEIYADTPDAARFPEHSKIETRRVNAATRLQARMAPGGGEAIRFQPSPPQKPAKTSPS